MNNSCSTMGTRGRKTPVINRKRNHEDIEEEESDGDNIQNGIAYDMCIYIIVYLIYTLSATIISAVVGTLSGAISYFTTRDISTSVGIFTGIAQAFTFVFAIIFYVSAVLNYFSLAEKFDGTGLLKRLDTLGRPGTEFNNTEEQY